MHSARSSVDVGTATLATTSWDAAGEGHGRTIVALHPGVGDSRIWQWCAPTWAAEGHRVVAYDRRGFGSTTHQVAAHDELADLGAVFAEASIQSALVVGNSIGGGLAIDFALAHPDLVDGLVLIAPSVSGFDYSTWVESAAESKLDEQVAGADSSGDLDEVNRLECHYWLDGVEQPEGRVAGEPRDLMLDMNKIALLARPTGEAAEHPPAWSRLSELDAPTLVVIGQFDLPGYHAKCAALVEAIPNGELVVLAHSAHCPSLDAPDELNRLVIDFARSIGS